jgi:hypothetical protein
LAHLSARLKQNCDWQSKKGAGIEEEITDAYILELLKKRIESLDVENAKRDIEPFISDRYSLDIWSKEFFLGVVDGLEFV